VSTARSDKKTRPAVVELNGMSRERAQKKLIAGRCKNQINAQRQHFQISWDIQKKED